MDLTAAQALVRFGLGHRPSDPVPPDPQRWLTAQLTAPDPIPSTAGAYRPASDNGTDDSAGGMMDSETMGGHGEYPLIQQGAINAAAQTAAPFREHLVWFWANHFTVSTRKPGCGVHIPAFFNETIRPHITGRFETLLLAVMRSPAMLVYLDNTSSVGAHSREAAGNSKRGMNENLGRECLELHSVSPQAGYTQADVIAMAKLLTGWSTQARKGGGQQFAFKESAHEPGPKTLMGRTFPEGEQGGIQALAFLANHPSCHRFLATKLVRHFVADDPPPDAVRQIEGVLRDTRGNLSAASRALVSLQAAWQPGTKLRTPIEFAIAACRTLNQPLPEHGTILLAQLGQPIWGAPQPNGWPDTTADWASSEAMLRRIAFAYTMAGEKEVSAPDELAQASLGPLLRPATLQAVRRAGSRREAVALLLSSPEFQRR